MQFGLSRFQLTHDSTMLSLVSVLKSELTIGFNDTEEKFYQTVEVLTSRSRS